MNKREIYKIVVFIIIGISILFIIEALSKPVFKNIFYIEKLKTQMRYFERCKDSVETLVLGCSHMNYSFIPIKFDTNISFNMAFGGQDAYYDYNILKKNIEQLPKLKTVILNLSPATYGYNQYFGAKVSIYAYMQLGYDPYEKSIYTAIENKLNILKYRNDFIYRFFNWYIGNKENKNDITCISFYGWTIGDTSYISLDKLKKSGRKYATIQEKENKYRDFYKKYFEKAIQLSLLKGKNVYIVTVPYTQYYWNNFSEEYRGSFINYKNYLIVKYPSVKVIYFAPGCLPDSFYFDAQHLNEKGAIYFTKMLRDSIIK